MVDHMEAIHTKIPVKSGNFLDRGGREGPMIHCTKFSKRYISYGQELHPHSFFSLRPKMIKAKFAHCAKNHGPVSANRRLALVWPLLYFVTFNLEFVSNICAMGLEMVGLAFIYVTLKGS